MNALTHARLFPAEIPCTQPLTGRHHALVEALDRLTTARTSSAGHHVLEQLTERVVTAATELATAIQPVIDHLPAITAALRDAAYYRHLDAQECSSGRCRNDREIQQALADAYTTALHAITSRQGTNQAGRQQNEGAAGARPDPTTATTPPRSR